MFDQILEPLMSLTGLNVTGLTLRNTLFSITPLTSLQSAVELQRVCGNLDKGLSNLVLHKI